MIRERAWRCIAKTIFAIADGLIWLGDKANNAATRAASARLRKSHVRKLDGGRSARRGL